MRFIKSLFTKKLAEYQPTSRLETLFLEAAEDPAKRPEFYRSLFHFDLFCLGKAITNPDGSQTAQFKTAQMDDQTVVYAFTSKAAVEWYLKAIGSTAKEEFLGFKTLTLFQMLQGKMGIYLNPANSCSKVFTPSEVTSMMEDFRIEDHSVSMPVGSNFMIGQPAEQPKKLLAALARYVQSSPSLKEIYFGLLAEKKGELRFVGVIDFADSVSPQQEQRTFEDLFTITKDTIDPGKIMDVCKLKDSGFEGAISEGALKAVSEYRV